MKPLLANEHLAELLQVAWQSVLLAFDFDGTLAPIVEDRGLAAMSPRTSDLFSRVCDLYPCAVISGRSVADVSSRLDGANVKYVVGNHGLEPGGDLEVFAAEIQRAVPHLESALEFTPGVEIEDKRFSLAVHFRASRNQRDVRKEILLAVSSLPVRMRVVLGKSVVNLVPMRAPNKGDALVALQAREGVSEVVYVGDDVTDEDVFALEPQGRRFTIRVGESKVSAARYFLHHQREIDVLLSKLEAVRNRCEPP